MPVIVEYELSPYSQSLKDLVYALINWGVLHGEKIKSEAKSAPLRFGLS
jgi:DNA-binding HxlR family transcriptional regulator